MTYKPTGADVGKEIVAITRFTDNGGYPADRHKPANRSGAKFGFDCGAEAEWFLYQ